MLRKLGMWFSIIKCEQNKLKRLKILIQNQKERKKFLEQINQGFIIHSAMSECRPIEH